MRLAETDYRTRLECYIASMLVIRKMRENGIISGEEYEITEHAIAEKYSIPKLSIYRDNDLI